MASHNPTLKCSCNRDVKLTDLNQHLTEVPHWSTVRCFCDRQVKISGVEEHLRNSTYHKIRNHPGNFTMECSCGRAVKRRELQAHMAAIPHFVTVQCICGFNVKSSGVEGHMANSLHHQQFVLGKVPASPRPLPGFALAAQQDEQAAAKVFPRAPFHNQPAAANRLPGTRQAAGPSKAAGAWRATGPVHDPDAHEKQLEAILGSSSSSLNSKTGLGVQSGQSSGDNISGSIPTGLAMQIGVRAQKTGPGTVKCFCGGSLHVRGLVEHIENSKVHRPTGTLEKTHVRRGCVFVKNFNELPENGLPEAESFAFGDDDLDGRLLFSSSELYQMVINLNKELDANKESGAAEKAPEDKEEWLIDLS